MRRRDILAATFVASAVPGLARAQPSAAPGRIGYLHSWSLGRLDDDNALVNSLAFLRKAWRERGFVEGKNVLLRAADGDPSRLPKLARELIDLGVGVLIAVGAPAVQAASQATKTVPIVAIDLVTDPVRAGYAASLSRPGGNITGLFMDQPSMGGKWIELLREAIPGIQRVRLIWNPTT